MLGRSLVVITAALIMVSALPSEETPTSEMAEYRAAAEEQLQLLQAQGMGDNACADLAKSTTKEIEDSVKATQQILDKLDDGSRCKHVDDDLVNKSQKAYDAAKEAAKSAEKAWNNAKGVKVTFSSQEFGQLKPPSCDVLKKSTFDKVGKEYQKAKDKHKKAVDDENAANKALSDVKKAAADAKSRCACKAQSEMEKAWKAASAASVVDANKKAWHKAQQMQCVIKGTSMSKCKTDGTPTAKKPSLGKGVSSLCDSGKPQQSSGKKRRI